MPHFTYKESNRRYRRVFLPAMVFYLIFGFAGPALLKHLGEPPKWAFAAVAFVSAAPVVLVFWLMGRQLRETDEYTRAVQTRAMLAGGGVTLSFAVVWGFLELFRVVPHLWTFLLVPLFFGTYGVAMIAYNLRNRSRASS